MVPIRIDQKKKLLIVDDSAFMRKMIGDFFEDHPFIELIGTARNGQDAIKKIAELMPDVITMDVEMPVMNGIDAVKEIMGKHPLPIIMLSSTTKSGAENTMLAMEYGAVDFVAKPGGAISLDLHKVKEELVEKVEHALNVSLDKMSKPVSYPKFEAQPITTSIPKQQQKLILIGTSTGGPRALQQVLTSLPANVGAPIVIVQHMPAGFTKSLAERLNTLCQIRVKEAEHGERLELNTAYIAPGSYHLKVERQQGQLMAILDQQELPRAGHRPAVDVLFESVSKLSSLYKVAVILTGMGSDGTKGLMQLSQSNSFVAIAESAKTSIVYGMPKSAAETGLVNEVVDLQNVAQTILKYI